VQSSFLLEVVEVMNVMTEKMKEKKIEVTRIREMINTPVYKILRALIVEELMELLLEQEEVEELNKAQNKIEEKMIEMEVVKALEMLQKQRNQIIRVTNLINLVWSLKLMFRPQFIEIREHSNLIALVITSPIAMRLPLVQIPERIENL
jgi:hypothetical protein